MLRHLRRDARDLELDVHGRSGAGIQRDSALPVQPEAVGLDGQRVFSMPWDGKRYKPVDVVVVVH